ncbi:MAG: hypothetical protein ACYC0T_07035 [Ramlibacter sp.]
MKTNLGERELHAPVVARRAGNKQIFEVVTPAESVWNDVVILHPERLERCMLIGVPLSPNADLRVVVAKKLSHLGPNDRNAAASTMKPVALMQPHPCFNRWHPERNTFSLGYGRLGLGGSTVSDVFTLCAPNGVQPLPNCSHIGAGQEIYSECGPT